MGGQPVQLVIEVKPSIAESLEHPRRVNSEYERAGVANLFMFASHWPAECYWLPELLEGRSANCEKVTLVCDNLNTPIRGAFHEVFDQPRPGDWRNDLNLNGAKRLRMAVGGTLPRTNSAASLVTV